jgi:thiol:disulfide interchange protein DsbG
MHRGSIFALCCFLAAATLPSFSADRLTGPTKRGATLAQAATSMLADMGQASWIRDGKSPHVIYVFFDPNCPYCHRVYESLRPQVQRAEVELRWIPIGILTTTSPGKAAALLEAPDPTAALHQNEQHFSVETGGLGGISEEPLPRDETLKRLDRNLALLRRSGNDAVPSLLFRDRQGEPYFIVGAPSRDALAEIVTQLE